MELNGYTRHKVAHGHIGPGKGFRLGDKNQVVPILSHSLPSNER